MEGLTPEEQEEYNRVLKQGNKVLKTMGAIILIIVIIVAYIKTH